MSSMPRDALNTNASNPGAIGVPNSRLNAVARAITSFGSEMSAGVIVFVTSAAVAQHALGADVEDLNDALRVRGDAREVGAVEDRALQGPRLKLGADQQIADDGVLRVAQCRDRYDCREAAAILADISQLVDVLDAA